MNQLLAAPSDRVLMGHAELPRPRGTATASFPLASSGGSPIEHAQWLAARDSVVAATRTVPSLILVLGAAGTGKSMLMRDLARVLSADGAEVLVQPRGDMPVELAHPVNDPFSRARARRIVLIDEADRMDAAALERLALLGPCSVVLAGLANPMGASKADCASAIIELAPLHPGEIATFVSARLAQSGLPEDLFDETALARLVARSGNVPRLLDALITAAVFVARGEAAHRITERHVDLAASFRDGEGSPPAPERAETETRRPAAAMPQPACATPEAAEIARLGPHPAWASANDEYRQLVASERRQQVRRGSAACAALAACAIGGWLWFEQTGRPDVDYPAIAAALQSASLAVIHDPAPTDAATNPAAALPAAAPVTALAAVATPAAPAVADTLAAPYRTFPADLEPHPAEVSETFETPAASGAQQVPASVEAVLPAAVAPLPRNAPVRVAVRYAGHDPGAAARAGDVAQLLRTAGFMVDSQEAIGRTSAGPPIRYFFVEDRDAADAVLRASGLPGPAILAKATPRGAPVVPGAIELFVPSAGLPPQGAPLPVNNAAGREDAPASGSSKQRLQRG